MMKLRFLLITVIAMGLTFINQSSYGQGDLDFDQLLRSGSDDANTYLGDYISPFARGFGFGMASGWYNTAKPHKSLGFDITVTANLAKVPNKDLFFNFVGSDVAGSPYNNLTLNTGGSTSLPTVFGGTTNETLQTSFTEDIGGQDVMVSQTFAAPEGIDVDDFGGYVPVPMAQLGIGLVKNTELKIRYIPTVSSDKDGYEIGLIGFGILHDIKQWIPGFKALPIDLSVFAGYTKLTTDFDLSDTNIAGSNQAASYDVSALTYQVLASKKLSVLTLYAGLGFNSISSKLNMTGTYLIETEFESIPGVAGPPIELIDPVNREFNNSGAKLTAGFRLKLAIITLHADYTVQEYNTVSAGVGISIR